MAKSKLPSAYYSPRGFAWAQITTLSYDYPDKFYVTPHFHKQDQFLYATSGAMNVRTEQGRWSLSPGQGLWIPAGVSHSIRMSGLVSMRALYLVKKLLSNMPRECRTVPVTPLLRELLVYACVFPGLGRKTPLQSHLTDVIVDQIESAHALSVQLPNPKSGRVKKIVDALLADPGDHRSLALLCKSYRVSPKTVERVFESEAKMSFETWRRMLKVFHAMHMAPAGTPLQLIETQERPSSARCRKR